MAKIYTKQTWQDEVLADSEKYTVKDDAGDVVYSGASIDLATAVAQAGTAVDAEHLNHIEDGLDALDTKVAEMEGASGMENPMTTEGDTIYGGAAGVPTRLPKGAAAQVLAMNGSATATQWRDQEFEIAVIIGDGVNVISTGVKGFIEVPFACVISAVRLVGDAAGSIVIDIWKDTYANFPPTVADTITASAKPTLSSAQKAENTTLTGWSKGLNKGDWLAFNVDSATTVKQVTLSITGKKS